MESKLVADAAAGGWLVVYPGPPNAWSHHYLFLVDGTPTLDPKATGIIQADHYGKASMVAVS